MSYRNVYKKLSSKSNVDAWHNLCSGGDAAYKQVSENLKNEEQMPDAALEQFLINIVPGANRAQLKTNYYTHCEKPQFQLKGDPAELPGGGEIKKTYRVISAPVFIDAVNGQHAWDPDEDADVEGLKKIAADKQKLLDLAKEMEWVAREGSIPWATFFTDVFSDFFHNKKASKGAEYIIRTLGLGHYLRQDTCVMMEIPMDGIEPKIPTVADAGFFEYFRPSPKRADKFGLTEPISGGYTGGPALAQMPEVVFNNVSGETISDVDIFD